MTKTIVNNFYEVLKHRERVFGVLIFGIITCSFLYAYFLHGAISNVVSREKLSKENRKLSTSLSVLDAKYFSIKNSIDMDLANALGFKNSEKISFISKNSITAMVYKNGL